MLAKKHRLTKEQFDTYFKVGKRYHSPHLQLIHVPAEHFSGAAVVGKKVFKLAVKRNEMRRRLYGVLYRHCVSEKQTGVYILIAKPPAKALTRLELLAVASEMVRKVVQLRHPH